MLKKVARQLLNYILPPRCGGCGEPVDEAHRLCSRCYQSLIFITEPLCEVCGFPFVYENGMGSLCAACIQERPVYHQARAAVVYQDRARDLILRFKHADATHLAPTLARMLLSAGRDYWQEDSILVPIPIHSSRLLLRRYNQAALLCHELGKLADLRVDVALLKRVKSTPSQGGLNRQQRYENVKSAFSVAGSRDTVLKNKTIILVDDVMTTGATVSCAAKALLKAGASKVNVLTFARVAGPSMNTH